MDQDIEALRNNIDAMNEGDTKILGQALINLQIGMSDSFTVIRNELARSSQQTEAKIAEVKSELEAELTNRSCNDFWSRHEEVQVAKQMIFLDEPKSTGTTDRDIEKLKLVAKKRIDELIGDYHEDVGFSMFWIEFVVRYHQNHRPARRASNTGREYDTIKVFFVNSYHVDMIAAAARKNKIDGWRIGQTITQSKMYKLAKTTVEKLNADTNHNAMYKVRNYKPVFKSYKQGVPDHLRKFEQPPTTFWPDPLCFMPSQRKANHVGIRASIPHAPNTYHPGNQTAMNPTFTSRFALQMANQTLNQPSGSSARPTNTYQPKQTSVRPRSSHPQQQQRSQATPLPGSSSHGGYADQLTAHEMQAMGAYNTNFTNNPNPNGVGASSFIPNQPSQPQMVPQPQRPQFYAQPTSGSQQYSNYNNSESLVEISNSQDSLLESSIIQRGANDNVVLKFPVSKGFLQNGLIPDGRLVGNKLKKAKKKKKKKDPTPDPNINNTKVSFVIPDTDDQTEDEPTETETETEDKINKKKRHRTLCSGSSSSAEKPQEKKTIFDSTHDSDLETLETESSEDETEINDEYQTKLIQLITEHAKYDSNKRQWKLLDLDEHDRIFAPVIQKEVMIKIDELISLKNKTTDYSNKRRRNLTIQITSDVKLLAFLEIGSAYDNPENLQVLPKLTGEILKELTDNYEVKGLDEIIQNINDIFLCKVFPPNNYMILSTKHVKLANDYVGAQPKKSKSKSSQKSKKDQKQD